MMKVLLLKLLLRFLVKHLRAPLTKSSKLKKERSLERRRIKSSKRLRHVSKRRRRSATRNLMPRRRKERRKRQRRALNESISKNCRESSKRKSINASKNESNLGCSASSRLTGTSQMRSSLRGIDQCSPTCLMISCVRISSIRKWCTRQHQGPQKDKKWQLLRKSSMTPRLTDCLIDFYWRDTFSLTKALINTTQ